MRQNLIKEYNSVTLFIMGVPVMQSLYTDLSMNAPFAALLFLFFMFWASSRITLECQP